MERQILQAAIQSNEAFLELDRAEIHKSLSDQARVIYRSIADYYKRDEGAKHVDLELLDKKLKKEFPKQYNIFKTVIDSMNFEERISHKNLLALIIDARREHLGRELSSVLLSPNKKGAEELMEQYRELDKLEEGDLEPDRDIFQDKDIDQLYKTIDTPNRIRLWPKTLNDRVKGGCLRGHHILVFGRPEIGKSLFVLNLAGGLLYDNHKVLFIENEDPEEDTTSRLICRLTEMVEEECRKDPDRVKRMLAERNFNNIGIKSCSPGTFNEIHSLTEKYKPDVVIINQLRNIYVGNTTRVEQMERAALKARELAKKQGVLVVSVTQAGDSAHNKTVLDMGDMEFLQ